MFLRQFTPKGNEEEQLFDSISGKKKKGLACYYGSPRDPRRRLAACPSDITCLWCSSAGGRSPAGQGTGCWALTGSRRTELGAAGAPAHEAPCPAPPAQAIGRGTAARVPPRVGSQAGAKPEPRQTATEKGAGHSQVPGEQRPPPSPCATNCNPTQALRRAPEAVPKVVPGWESPNPSRCREGPKAEPPALCPHPCAPAPLPCPQPQRCCRTHRLLALVCCLAPGERYD